MNHEREVLILGHNQMSEKHMNLLHDRPDIALRISPDITADFQKNVEVVVTSGDKLDMECIKSFNALKHIITASSGYNYVDIEAARQRGVGVSNCPDFAAISVAEHALSLIMATSRRIVRADHGVRMKEWDPFPYQGMELYGKTLGIIGYGRIGRRLAHICSNFGMDLEWVDHASDQFARDRLYKKSDIVSVHVPLNVSTKGMIGKSEFSKMKDGVTFINTSRGGVLDQEALIEALTIGKVGVAGLDVFEPEPLPSDSPLKLMDNVIMTPHIGAYTKESKARLATECYLTLDGYLKGQPINLVN